MSSWFHNYELRISSKEFYRQIPPNNQFTLQDFLYRNLKKSLEVVILTYIQEVSTEVFLQRVLTFHRSRLRNFPWTSGSVPLGFFFWSFSYRASLGFFRVVSSGISPDVSNPLRQTKDALQISKWNKKTHEFLRDNHQKFVQWISSKFLKKYFKDFSICSICSSKHLVISFFFLH